MEVESGVGEVEGVEVEMDEVVGEVDGVVVEVEGVEVEVDVVVSNLSIHWADEISNQDPFGCLRYHSFQ